MNSTGSGFSSDKDARKAGEAAASQALKAMGGTPPLALFVFAAPSYPYDQLLAGIRSVSGKAAILGCSTAGEFTDKSSGHDSVSILAMGGDNMRIAHGIGHGLRKDQPKAVRDAMAHFAGSYKDARAQGFTFATCFVLTDALAGNGERLVELVAEESTSLAQVVGGAAADAAKFEKTEVLYGDKSQPDAVVVASVFTRTPIGLGVQHGLKPATHTKVVTRAVGGALIEMDGKPAFEAYRDFAKSKGVALEAANPGTFMIVNQLGMVTPDGHKLRAPLKADDQGSLTMASEIPAGTAVCIMQGTNEALIASSKLAAETAVKALKGAKPAGAVSFDCICRRIFLGDDYKKQIETIAAAVGGVPMAGWESYGEISLTPDQFSGFHNSTSVVAVIPQ